VKNSSLTHASTGSDQSSRGCRIGRLGYDPEAAADQTLRTPVNDTFDWLLRRTGEVVAQAQRAGELPATLDVRATAASIGTVGQGGCVTARATGSSNSSADAIDGPVSLLEGSVRRGAHRRTRFSDVEPESANRVDHGPAVDPMGAPGEQS
jgi:hypothetical protein